MEKKLIQSYFDLCEANSFIFSNLKKLFSCLNDGNDIDVDSLKVIIDSFLKATDLYKKILFVKKDVDLMINALEAKKMEFLESDEKIIENFISKHRQTEQ